MIGIVNESSEFLFFSLVLGFVEFGRGWFKDHKKFLHLIVSSLLGVAALFCVVHKGH